jgi:hypothetical protein
MLSDFIFLKKKIAMRFASDYQTIYFNSVCSCILPNLVFQFLTVMSHTWKKSEFPVVKTTNHARLLWIIIGSLALMYYRSSKNNNLIKLLHVILAKKNYSMSYKTITFWRTMPTLLLAEICGHVSIKSGGIKRELTADQLVHNKTTPCLRFARSKNERMVFTFWMCYGGIRVE